MVARALPLIGIWLVCCAINVGKAAHIDDAAHLEIARWIAGHPLHPMQGEVSWGARPEPIHRLNQPHLFFYLLAGASSLIEDPLLAGQLLEALFVAFAIAAFASLFRVAVGEGEHLAAALFFLGPAFVPGQNVMVDAPLLAAWLLFLLCIARARGEHELRYLALAAFVAGIACLMKYTSLLLLGVLALDLWLRPRTSKLAWVMLIPIAMLGGWSLFNWLDYGRVHLFDRPIENARFSPLEALGIAIGRAALYLVTLGAIAPFAIALVPRWRAHPRWALGAIVAIAVLTVATQVVAANGPEQMRGETIPHSLARAIFFVVGVALTVEAMGAPLSGLDDEQRLSVALRATFALCAAFIVVLSPFVAVRHVMLALPPLMMIIGRAHRPLFRAERPWLAAASALTIALGLWLGASDRRWAECYRDEAQARSGERAFFVGHWGWQWHAREAGLAHYTPGVTELAPGDRLIRPRLVDQPPIDPGDAARLALVETRVCEGGSLALLRTTTERLGYYSVWHGLPYTLSWEPLETFEVLEVRGRAAGGEPEIPHSVNVGH